MGAAGKLVSVYIRLENLEKWQELSNKSEWVNDCLTGREEDLEKQVKRIAREVFEEIAQERGGY